MLTFLFINGRRRARHYYRRKAASSTDMVDGEAEFVKDDAAFAIDDDPEDAALRRAATEDASALVEDASAVVVADPEDASAVVAVRFGSDATESVARSGSADSESNQGPRLVDPPASRPLFLEAPGPLWARVLLVAVRAGTKLRDGFKMRVPDEASLPSGFVPRSSPSSSPTSAFWSRRTSRSPPPSPSRSTSGCETWGGARTTSTRTSARPRWNLPTRNPISAVAASRRNIHVAAAASPRPACAGDRRGTTDRRRRHFSLIDTLRELQQANSYLLFLLILCLSGIWPYVEIFMLLYAYLRPS